MTTALGKEAGTNQEQAGEMGEAFNAVRSQSKGFGQHPGRGLAP